MSKVNISPNLFLEVNEINRLIKSLKDDGYKLLIKHLVKSPKGGIAEDANNTYFKATVNSDNTITINSGVAFDHNLDPIVLSSPLKLNLSVSSTKYWIILSRATTNIEEGTVNISALGGLSGTGTEFTKVLRGQPNFPTKVKFESTLNPNEYEVVDVTSDTVATLAGAFVAENNIKYKVIGTFTPGFQPTDENRYLYEYDSCNISVVQSDLQPVLTDGQYLIASVTFATSSRALVTDERYAYLINSTNTSSVGETESQRNSVAVLTRSRLFNRRLQLAFEFGVKVNRYELVTTQVDTIFNVSNFDSTFFGTSVFPNSVFDGWLLINRGNMKSVVIETNVGMNLYVPEWDNSILDAEITDFIIVPNFSEIEVEVTMSGSLYTEMKTPPYYKRFNLQNYNALMDIFLEFCDTTITLKYRMLDNGKTTKFQSFNISPFINYEGNSEPLGDSSFSIPALAINTKNYS